MTRSARTSDRLGHAASRVFRPLLAAVAVFVLLHTLDADQTSPTLWRAVQWAAGVLFALWLALAVGSVLTEPEETRS